jgi:hypothetical protein
MQVGRNCVSTASVHVFQDGGGPGIGEGACAFVYVCVCVCVCVACILGVVRSQQSYVALSEPNCCAVVRVLRANALMRHTRPLDSVARLCGGLGRKAIRMQVFVLR